MGREAKGEGGIWLFVRLHRYLEPSRSRLLHNQEVCVTDMESGSFAPSSQKNLRLRMSHSNEGSRITWYLKEHLRSCVPSNVLRPLVGIHNDKCIGFIRPADDNVMLSLDVKEDLLLICGFRQSQ